MVACLMRATAPVSWPIAKLLDFILGEHKHTRYNHNQLKAIVDMHSNKQLNEEEIKHHIAWSELGTEDSKTQLCKGLNKMESNVIKGALNMKICKAEKCMRDIQKVYALSMDREIDQELLDEVRHKGYSRIPIYVGKANNMQYVCILLAKSLIGIKIEENETIASMIRKEQFKVSEPIFISPKTDLETILKTFRKGETHLAVVCTQPQ